jgi:hypothetical protein
MKKALLIALATLFVAGFAYGKDYIGLYFDTGHSVCSKDAVGDVGLYYYVFALPTDDGMYAVEFKIVFPDMVYDYGSMTLNAGINLTLGDISTGWSATFAVCQPNGLWVQVYRQRVYVDTSIAPNGVIMIAETDDSHNIGLATCDFMDARFTVLNNGFINLPCEIGTKDASWGAIKSLF